MLELPFNSKLKNSKKILIAGAGGGFDVFTGLPLYFGLKSEGREVHLANLSFSFLPPDDKARLSLSMLTVNADTKKYTPYFPEKFLSQWFKEEMGEDISIYCFERRGVKPLLAGYKTLVTKLGLDTIILVDGGTDSLMRGDEDRLGTPKEDASSITAVSLLEIETKVLACLGFGADHFHGVSNYFSLEAIAELTKAGGFLGMISLQEEMPEVKKYRQAAEYVFRCMPEYSSIVSGSVLSALAGNYGDYHSTTRTKWNELWINPLMAVYFCFNLKEVAERILYLDALKETETFEDVENVISEFRQKNFSIIRKRGSIPD